MESECSTVQELHRVDQLYTNALDDSTTHLRLHNYNMPSVLKNYWLR